MLNVLFAVTEKDQFFRIFELEEIVVIPPGVPLS